MKDKDKVYLLHIKDSTKWIIELQKQFNKNEFKESRLFQNGVIREVEIIGEASNKLSKDIKEKYPEVAWIEIIGMRNKVIHEYFGVDYEIIWHIIVNNLQDLRNQLENILKNE